MARSPLERTFSWSVSRDRLFRACARAYYYRYYAAWGGWKAGAAPDARELYVLKQLETRHQWAGDAVHRALREVLEGLRRGRLVPLPEADARLTRVMRLWFKASREGAYWREPKRGGLVEHEYGIPVPADAWRALHAGARRALSGAYGLGLFERLARLHPDAWLSVETPGSFEVGGVPVHCVPDLSFREGDRIVIVDWKTGFAEADLADAPAARFQLTCYSLYARARWGAAPERTRLGAALLAGPAYQESATDEAELAAAETAIRSSMAEMRARLVDPEANAARIDDFPRTDDLTRCGRCPFRRPCRGAAWQAPPDPPADAAAAS